MFVLFTYNGGFSVQFQEEILESNSCQELVALVPSSRNKHSVSEALHNISFREWQNTQKFDVETRPAMMQKCCNNCVQRLCCIPSSIVVTHFVLVLIVSRVGLQGNSAQVVAYLNFANNYIFSSHKLYCQKSSNFLSKVKFCQFRNIYNFKPYLIFLILFNHVS